MNWRSCLGDLEIILEILKKDVKDVSKISLKVNG